MNIREILEQVKASSKIAPKPVEEEAETTTSSIPADSAPVYPGHSKCQMFDVGSDVFRRFTLGRNKFERWNNFLDRDDEDQKKIYDAIKRSKSGIVLRDSTTGAMISLRRRSSNGL